MDSADRETIKHYRWLMTAFGVVYILGALTYFFLPNELIYLLNIGPRAFHVMEALPLPQDRFWLIQAVAMLAMLSALSFLSAEKPAIQGYAVVHILAKVVEAVGFLTAFLNGERYFAYIVAITVDVVIALVLAISLTRVSRALKRASALPAANVDQPGAGIPKTGTRP